MKIYKSLFLFFLIIGLSTINLSLKACDTSPVLTASNTTDIGGGFFTFDMQVCLGSDGSQDGFDLTMGCGLNITATSAATLTNGGKVVTASIVGGVLTYTYPGFPGTWWEVDDGIAGPCFNFTVTVDGNPANCPATVTGINDGCLIISTSWSVNVPGPPPGCGDVFYDSGGPGGNYANPELFTYTICPDIPGEMVTINFASFSIENGWDYFYVWDANSNAGAPMSTFTGSTVPGPITATNPSGCLTITFDADNIISAPGFEINVSCPTILPIDLLSFSGENQSDVNILTWETASEINNDFFILERGLEMNGQLYWESLDIIQGSGNSNIMLGYQYIDDNPKFNTINYYRLKQVDFDGATQYFHPVAIDNHALNNISNLYPNPTGNQFSFSISNVFKMESITLKIYNGIGQLMKTQNFTEIESNNFNCAVSDLSEGIYFVHLNINETSSVKKLTIVR